MLLLLSLIQRGCCCGLSAPIFLLLSLIFQGFAIVGIPEGVILVAPTLLVDTLRRILALLTSSAPAARNTFTLLLRLRRILTSLNSSGCSAY